ncbi:MAG: DUF86 domain-containing protein [Anaerolineales bacterium]|nr:DUF86 domain-containing protein [Anaerolineales bacterium]
MRDYSLYLKDILAAIESIESFIAGMNLDTFQIDDKTNSAVMRKLEIIGEAVKQIPDEMRQKYSQIPWKEMAGMRDKLIHFYFGVDYDLVWKAITERLPNIKQDIEKMMKNVD